MSGTADFAPAGDARALKARSASGAAITLVAQAAKFVLQFGSQVALARLLLPDDFGLVAMVAPLIAAAMLLTDLGLSQATVQRPRISQRELSSLFWLNLAIGTALAALAAAAAPLVADFYHRPALVPLVIGMALPLLLLSAAAQPLAILNRRMEFAAIARIEVGALLASVLVGLAGAGAGFGTWALVAMQVANGLATMVLSFALSGFRPSPPRIDREALHLLRFGGNVTGYNLLGYLITNLDNVLIGARFGAGPLGLYDRAYKLMFQPLWQMTTPAARVAVPLLSRLQGEADHYRDTYLTMLGLILAVTIPGILCAILFAGPIVTILLGERWASAAPIFAALGACALTLQLRQAASWLFVSQGRVSEQLRWGGLGSAAIIAAYAIGIAWGPIGIAVAAALASAFLQAPILWWAVTRQGPVSGRDALGLLGPIGLATALTAALLALLQRQAAWTSIAGLLFALAFSYIGFVAILSLFPVGRRLIHQGSRMRHFIRKG